MISSPMPHLVKWSLQSLDTAVVLCGALTRVLGQPELDSRLDRLPLRHAYPLN